MRHDYSFEGEHIYLIPMDEDTSEQYRKLRNREDNRVFFFNSTVIDRKQQEKWFCNYLNKENEYMFAVFLKKTNTFIGGIGIYDIDVLHGIAEVGRIIIDRNIAHEKGYGTEAIMGISRIAGLFLEIKEIYAHIYADNIASKRTFLKAGFIVLPMNDKNGDIIRMKLTMD